MPPFASRRLYHVTPLNNLESILLDGALRSIGSGVTPDLDVAAPLARELRAHADVGDGRHVDEFVPFSASPDAERWAELRAGAEEPHWSAAARALTAADYAVLVAVGRDLGTDLVVADGDAAAPITRFTVGDPAKAIASAARDRSGAHRGRGARPEHRVAHGGEPDRGRQRARPGAGPARCSSTSRAHRPGSSSTRPGSSPTEPGRCRRLRTMPG